MKLDSIEPNARYDLVNGKPSVFEKDNDGSYLYRYNIKPEMGIPDGETVETQMGIPDGETVETQIGWKCNEIRVWGKPTKGVLKKTIIRSYVDESMELAIVNAYNKHVLKIKVDSAAVDAYREYLQFTEDLDAMLVSDFSTVNE